LSQFQELSLGNHSVTRATYFQIQALICQSRQLIKQAVHLYVAQLIVAFLINTLPRKGDLLPPTLHYLPVRITIVSGSPTRTMLSLHLSLHNIVGELTEHLSKD